MELKRLWAIILTLMFIVSCGGIDSDLKKSAAKQHKALEKTRADIASAKKTYNEWKTNPESNYEKFERYDKHYNWAGQYEDALSDADNADKIWKEIDQILSANAVESEGQLNKKITQIKNRIGLALEKSKGPDRQLKVLEKLMAGAQVHIREAEKQGASMKRIPPVLKPEVDTAISDSKQHGWGKEQDLTGRFSQIEAAVKEAIDGLGAAGDQNGKDDPDYAIIADSLHVIAQNLPAVQAAEMHLRQRIGEMNRSYTKRLIDMKSVFFITVGRTSWDNSYDSSREVNYLFQPREVDEATFKYFENEAGDIASGLRWIRAHKSERMWENLGLATIARENSPPGHNDAVFWVHSATIDYYHRYKMIENDVESESDWQKVGEAVFAANLNNLGMDIISKPYGMYESEVIRNAAPPGLAYVGNEKYGSWQQDASGSSFWSFYGKYAFLNALLGGNRYYYNDWDLWRRDYRGRRPYYGRNRDGSPMYGTSGTIVRNTPGYQSTTFAKRGGLKTAQASVRSAASGVRGRGPGGRGK
jgi:PBP1b-binding outer membrane lipoprotein LpoB